MKSLAQQINEAYWLPSKGNSSADRNTGNAFVDDLTLGQLATFFDECKTGPTYVMVSRHVNEMLKKFPPHIEQRKERAVMAVDAAIAAFKELRTMVDQLNELG